MFHFYTPLKCRKTSGFLTFSGGIDMKYWTKMDLRRCNKVMAITQKWPDFCPSGVFSSLTVKKFRYFVFSEQFTLSMSTWKAEEYLETC